MPKSKVTKTDLSEGVSRTPVKVKQATTPIVWLVIMGICLVLGLVWIRRIFPPVLTLGMKERAKRKAPTTMPAMRQAMFGDHSYRMGVSDGINTHFSTGLSTLWMNYRVVIHRATFLSCCTSNHNTNLRGK